MPSWKWALPSWRSALPAPMPRPTIDRGPRANHAPASRTEATRRFYLVAKRCLDVTLALVLIVATAPLLLAIAALILVDSGRPVFFRQTRMGSRPRRSGGLLTWQPREFRITKFRTMVPRAAESPIHEEFVRAFISGDLAPAPDGEPTYKLAADPRVTRIGQALRATSLDELPQLFDVLRGTMSFVGPRPLPAYEVAAFDGRYHERLAALPGISGLWQIDGRGRVPFEQMMQMDIDYVRRQSLRLDGMLLVRTVPAVLSRRGAR